MDLDNATETALGASCLQTLTPFRRSKHWPKRFGCRPLLKTGVRILLKAPSVIRGADKNVIPPRDSRFRDPTWQSNAIYRRVAHGYLELARQLMALVENDKVDWRTQERSRLLMGVITSALAPTNTLPGNPEALKLAIETRGRSLLDGAVHFVRDVVDNRGLPSQVDVTAFTVGKDLAATPGAVIYRTDMFELIQYTPTTDTVQDIPLLLLPPPVNKYYFWDLAPGRSLIEYAVSRGVTVFTIVWRDPKPGNGSWGVSNYMQSALQAAEVTKTVAQFRNVHVFGDCSGGMLTCLLLSHQASTNMDLFRTATLGVTVLDFGEPGGIGVTASDRSLRKMKKRADRAEIISADSIGDTFVWMRPDDLVWRYLVNDWLLGKNPPAFDVLFWNSDGQGLPSQLAYEMTQFSLANSLIRPGAATALGLPVDLSAVKTDTYIVAGLTDHISPWKACYAATQHLGGANEFVLTPTGHVQSIIYPPGNPKAAFFTGDSAKENNPERWRAGATKNTGSWWPHWVDWLIERSDAERPAPTRLGDDTYHPLSAAPGRYVLGE